MGEFRIQDYVYAKEFFCPICETDFYAYVVRKTKIKYISSDLDLKAHYAPVDPLLYDVLLCQHCGYAVPQLFFGKIPAKAADNILTKIKPHYKARYYSDQRTLEEAIDLFKLALISSIVKGSLDSEQGYICMKLAWLYRMAENPEQEQEFLKKTIQQFNQAYISEEFPICELDEETFSYMLAAFYKLAGESEKGLKWLGKVVASGKASSRLKDKAADLKTEIQKELKTKQEGL